LLFFILIRYYQNVKGFADSVLLLYAIDMKTKRKPGPKCLHSGNYRAADGATDLRVVSVKMPMEMIKKLSKMGGDRSMHIRAAINRYIEDFG
jgi:hypothetical protein